MLGTYFQQGSIYRWIPVVYTNVLYMPTLIVVKVNIVMTQLSSCHEQGQASLAFCFKATLIYLPGHCWSWPLLALSDIRVIRACVWNSFVFPKIFSLMLLRIFPANVLSMHQMDPGIKCCTQIWNAVILSCIIPSYVPLCSCCYNHFVDHNYVFNFCLAFSPSTWFHGAVVFLRNCTDNALVDDAFKL